MCCICKGPSTPLKKRRLTPDAMSSSLAPTLLESVDKHISSWSSAVSDQTESRHRMLASRNLFEVRSALCRIVFYYGFYVCFA